MSEKLRKCRKCRKRIAEEDSNLCLACAFMPKIGHLASGRLPAPHNKPTSTQMIEEDRYDEESGPDDVAYDPSAIGPRYVPRSLL